MADHKAEIVGSEGAASAPVSSYQGVTPEGRLFRFRSFDGLLLVARIFDAPKANRLPLLCLPGLSRNSRDFLAVGRFFAGHPTEPRMVAALDYRGRGLSQSDPSWRNYRPNIEAQDVLTAMTVLGIERCLVLGTSRGGILAMLLGALRPTLLAGVVLNDIGPILEGTGLARIKSYLAARPAAGTWEEAIALMRNTFEAQFPAVGEREWRAMAAAYFAETEAGLVPQFDPALNRAIDSIDLVEKIPALWPQFMSLARVPVLAIRGELSDMLSIRTLQLMAERHPQFEQLTVRDQGHAPLLRDDMTLQRLLAFARRCEIP